MYRPETEQTEAVVNNLTALISTSLQKRASLDAKIATDESSHYRDVNNKRVTELRRMRTEVEDLMYGQEAYQP